MTIVLIPAYKPDERLAELACSLQEKGVEVVIVDDGSGEAFRPVFEQACAFAQVITCPQNGGKGTAIKTGLAYIQANFAPPYTVTTADADGQHRLRDILRVARRAKQRPGSLVLGCRTISREMPLRNWFGNFYTKIAFFLATGKFVGDTQTGLRGFSDRLLPFLQAVHGERYEYETNVLLHWARCDRPIAEVPIRTIYPDGNSTSHFRPLRDSAVIYGEILKFSAPAFGCFLLDLLLFCLLMGLFPTFAEPYFANIAARLCSAALYYSLTAQSLRRYPNDKRLSLSRFALMEGVSLLLNTAAVSALLTLGMPPFGAKLLADTILYFAGLVPQRRLIYRDKRR